MTYNTAPRRRFTKKQREAFLEKHKRICHWCREVIEPGQPWAIEHMVPRELLPDARADADANLAPIHAHPATCHKLKSRRDIAMIAKSNRQQKLAVQRGEPKPPPKMKGPGFRKGSRPIANRPFPKESRPFPKKRRV